MNADELARTIRQAQRGDPAAYDRLIDAYAPRLHGYLYRVLGSRDDADDLLQELFLRVVRTIESYTHDGRFEAWLFRIAANLARDRLRRVRRTPRMLSMDGRVSRTDESATGEPIAAGDPNQSPPDAALLMAESVDQLQRALGGLPNVEREVIMLRHFSDLSFAEIAEAMGTPLGTALARAHRGLAKLRKLLTGSGLEQAG